MISIVVGTRPEIIKMSPIIKEFYKKNVEFNLINTGQHYDDELSTVFFNQLEIRKPDINLNCGRFYNGVNQTAEYMIQLQKALKKTKTKLALAEGDTNSVLATALASSKMGIKIGHVESGLRSYDRRMPEEYNRIVTDHISDYLFAPTHMNEQTLKAENVLGKIYQTGNTVIDCCIDYLDTALRESNIMDKIDFDEFILMTVHRVENVTDKKVMKNLYRFIELSPIPIVFPLHPFTKRKLKQFFWYDCLKHLKHLKFLKPVDYFDMLTLLKNCKLVFTDSGGLQEEITAPNISKRALIFRRSTERNEAVSCNFAKLVGTHHYQRALNTLKITLKTKRLIDKESPYGNGTSGKKIVNIIRKLDV